MTFIRGLTIDNRRGYLIAVGYEDGQMYVYDVNKCGLE